MLEKVAAIIREQLNQENVEITEATRFKEDLEVDSLDLFELVMAFEEEYGVSIPSEELENMATVGDVIYSGACIRTAYLPSCGLRPFDPGIIRICNITQNDEKDQKDNENKDHGTSTNRISRFPGRYGLGGRT